MSGSGSGNDGAGIARRTALVTGANRGIGLEVCRQLAQAGLRVILTARDAALGAQAARTLENAGLDVAFEHLDVASDDSVAECADRLARARVRVDVLVNNAGAYASRGVLSTPPDVVAEAINVNMTGALRTSQAWLPGMRRRKFGRIVNVSSGYGSFAEGLEGPAAYCVSKAAMNALTVKLAAAVARLPESDLKINAACPGWVRTRMGGPGADLSPEQGADTIVWLATLDATGPHGGFFRDRQPIDW